MNSATIQAARESFWRSFHQNFVTISIRNRTHFKYCKYLRGTSIDVTQINSILIPCLEWHSNSVAIPNTFEENSREIIRIYIEFEHNRLRHPRANYFSMDACHFAIKLKVTLVSIYWRHITSDENPKSWSCSLCVIWKHGNIRTIHCSSLKCRTQIKMKSMGNAIRSNVIYLSIGTNCGIAWAILVPEKSQ